MNPEIDITERATTYDIKYEYHSDLMCQNYDAGVVATVSPNGRVSIYPDSGHREWVEKTFTFEDSDPDRVIAVAKMMLAIAEMVKRDNAKLSTTIDTSIKV